MTTLDMAPFDTARLHLRPLGEGDEALYCSLYTDPDLMYHIATPMSPDAAQRSFRAACRQQSPQKQRWIITEHGTGDAIGLLGLFVNGDAAEIGVMLLKPWQGRGNGTEAMASMVDRVFTAQAVRLLWIRQGRDNTAVTGMMRKLGFKVSESSCVDQHERYWDLDYERWLERHGSLPEMAMPGKSE